jgi:ABC-2 type transport system ATP-binding protein
MNIMTGCLSATEGHVRIDGYDIFDEPKKAKKLIGYLPEQPPLYMNETPAEYLRFVGEAKGLRGAELQSQIESVMEQTKITEMRNRRISALSKGYKQRVGIAQALLGNPKVIILDEPTVGLDPIQIIEIRELIRELGQEHTVILSSHILSEVQTICEKILIIAHGKLVAFDEPANLEKSLLNGDSISITTDAAEDEVRDIVGGIEDITEANVFAAGDELTEAQLRTDNENIYDVSRKIFFAFAESGKALLEMNVKKASLEDVFIELTEDSKDDLEDGSDEAAADDSKSEGDDTPSKSEESEGTEE